MNRILLLVGFCVAGLAGGATSQTLYFTEKDPAPRVLAWQAGAISVRYVPPAPFVDVAGIAVDSQDRLYVSLVAPDSTSLILRIDPGGASAVMTPPLTGIYGLHVAADDSLFFVEQFTNILHIDAQGTLTTVFSLHPASLGAITTDALGTVILSAEGYPGLGVSTLRVLETLGATTARIFHSTPGSPTGPFLHGVDSDPCGNFYHDERSSAGGSLFRLGPAGSVLVHAVPYPAVFGKHVSDGQGTVFAIVDRRPYTSGVTPHLVMISGGVATTLYSVSPSGTLGDLTASFAPCAPTAATGSVGASAGGPFDVLVVNGSAGSAFRRVSIPRAQSFQVAVATPPTGGPALFAVVGMIGVPDPKDGLAGPAGFGRLILTPCPLAPADPFLFTLVDGFGIGGSPPILQATPTPWSVTLPGLDLDFSFTIQGVIQDVTATPFAVSATNAIRIDIE